MTPNQIVELNEVDETIEFEHCRAVFEAGFSKYNKGLLDKTRTYLIGNLEFEDDKKIMNWRRRFTEMVKPMGIITMSPTDKVFLNFISKENAAWRAELREKADNNRYQEVATEMKQIRRRDLAMTDLSTFIVCNFNPDVPTAGTHEELVTANRGSKPIFFVIESKSKIPVWLTSYIQEDMVFDSIDGVVDKLQKINSGELEVSNKYWKFLDYQYR